MISLKYGFLFIHIPKTAGNSIQNILRDYSEDVIVCNAPYQDGVERFDVRSTQFKTRKHSTLQEYHSQMRPDDFQRLLKFTTVRNPWDRAISFYFSPHRGKVTWDRDDFIKFVNKDIQPVQHFTNLKNQSGFSTFIDFLKRVEVAKNKNQLFNAIDFFIRYEHLNEDFNIVCDRIGIPHADLPKRNASTRGNYTDYYDEALVALVRRKFSEEIKYFGYEFNGTT